jgi:hypothetical protein
MADKWEWDTFVEINNLRKKAGTPPLLWCCGIESNTRGSCDGKVFHKFRVNRKVTQITCQHWTQPQTIAKMFCAKDKHALEPKYRSGSVIIYNNNVSTFAFLAYGKDKAIAWHEMPIGSECPYYHASQSGDVQYDGHHTACFGTSEDTIEVACIHCSCCGKSWQLPY